MCVCVCVWDVGEFAVIYSTEKFDFVQTSSSNLYFDISKSWNAAFANQIQTTWGFSFQCCSVSWCDCLDIYKTDADFIDGLAVAVLRSLDTKCFLWSAWSKGKSAHVSPVKSF